MPEFRLTFGSQYGSAEYGAAPHPVGGYVFVHRNGWWTIVAPDYDAARALVGAMIGEQWSNLYDLREQHDTSRAWELFPRGELLRLIHPAMRDQAVHLLVGDMPPNAEEQFGVEASVGGRLLVTVWGNGTGEVAWRENEEPRSRWLAPSVLEPAP